MTEPGTPDVQNLYARLGTGAPHLCFAGHTDVVPAGEEAAWTRPPFGGEIADGVLYGRGAADMKGGIACFLAAALDYLKANGGLQRGSLSFLITGDEESVAINGTPKLLAWLKARGETLDACLVGEPASDEAVGDQIKIGRRGYVNAAAGRARQAGPLRLRRARRQPHPEARAHHRPAVLHAARHGHGAFPALEPAGDDHLGAEHGDQRHPGLGAGQLQHPLQRPAHARPKIEAWVREHCESAAKEVGARFSLTFDGTGNVFLTKPGPLVETMRARDPGRHGPRAGAHHHRRHVGRALHQGLLPGGRGRPAQCHGAPGGRARAGGRPRDADADLPRASSSAILRPDAAKATGVAPRLRSAAQAIIAALAVYASVRVAVVLLLGFSSGLPLALSGETLRVWMADSGVDLGTIGLAVARRPARTR